MTARAYPNSTFVGFDYHAESIEVARRRAVEAGVDGRVRFEVVAAATHIRRSLAPDGPLLLVEPMAGETLADNANVLGRLFYSAGMFICVPHAKAQGGRHTLGPQVPESTWRTLLAEAGFSRFRRATETPFNRVFEARP